MADDNVPDLALSDHVVPTYNADAEELFLAHWSEDITRAARRGVLLAATAWPTVEDVAQEVRIRVLRAFRLLSPPPEGYVRVVIKNAVANTVRRPHGFFPEALDPDQFDTLVAPALATDEYSHSVRLWVRGLPQPFRELYSLLYVQGATQREAARALSLSQPRIAQLHRELLALGRHELPDVAA